MLFVLPLSDFGGSSNPGKSYSTDRYRLVAVVVTYLKLSREDVELLAILVRAGFVAVFRR